MLYDTFAALDRELGGRGSLLSGMSLPMWRAPMDVRRESDRFVAELDLPGVDPSSIDVTFEDGWLAVRAERSESHETEDQDWVVRERSHEAVVRRFVVGETVDVDAITADYHDGVLTLSLPLAEKAKPRRIALSGAPATRELGAGSGTSDTAGRGSQDHGRGGVLTRLVPRRWRGRHAADRARGGFRVPVRRSKAGAA